MEQSLVHLASPWPPLPHGQWAMSQALHNSLKTSEADALSGPVHLLPVPLYWSLFLRSNTSIYTDAPGWNSLWKFTYLELCLIIYLSLWMNKSISMEKSYKHFYAKRLPYSVFALNSEENCTGLIYVGVSVAISLYHAFFASLRLTSFPWVTLSG